MHSNALKETLPGCSALEEVKTRRSRNPSTNLLNPLAFACSSSFVDSASRIDHEQLKVTY